MSSHPNRRLQVAFVNNRLHLGGAETVMKQLHAGLRRQGHGARIYVAEHEPFATNPPCRCLCPRLVHRLFHSRLNRLVRRAASPHAWKERTFLGLAHRGLDLVHVHNFHGHYASAQALATLARSIPVVWTFHRFWGVTGGCDHPGECTRYLEACGACPRVDEWPINGTDNTAEQLADKLRWLAPAPLTIVSPSHHLARIVRASRVGRNWRVEVIPNGVDPEEFRPFAGDRAAARRAAGLAPDKTVVLAVNRSFADPLKGGDILADAAGRLDFNRCQVALVGGETDTILRRAVPGTDIVSLGYVNDRARLAALLQLADIFLYASPRENFPCATIEAMASGCCVVSTPTDGVLEQIRHGHEGLFAPDFTGAALAAEVRRVLPDTDQIRRFGEAARARVQREFSETVMVERHLALYRDLLAAWRARPSHG